MVVELVDRGPGSNARSFYFALACARACICKHCGCIFAASIIQQRKTTIMQPVGKLTCLKCSSDKVKAVPFGRASIVIGCDGCGTAWQVDFDLTPEQPKEQPNAQAPQPSPNGQDISAQETAQETAQESGSEVETEQQEVPEPEGSENGTENATEGAPDVAGEDPDESEAQGENEPDEAPEGAEPWPDEGVEEGEYNPDDEAPPEQESEQPEQPAVTIIPTQGPEPRHEAPELPASVPVSIPASPVELAAKALESIPTETQLDTELIPSQRNGRTQQQREAAQIENFYRRIGEVMKDNQHDRYVGGQRSGKIWERDLYKASLGGVKVFAKKQERKNKKYNVVIAVDASGSMSNGHVIYLAAELVRLMVKGLSRHGLDFAVLTFNARVRVCKRFEDVQPDLDVLTSAIVHEADSGYRLSTHTFEAILEAEKMLKTRHEGHNILLLITDGLPEGAALRKDKAGNKFSAATGGPNENLSSTRIPEKLRHLERHTDVIAIGVGRQGQHGTLRNLHAHIPKAQIVEGREQFMTMIEKRFARLITRG